MLENSFKEIRHYPPQASKGLRDRIIGNEKYSPNALFNFAWSRMSNLNGNLENVLAKLVESGDPEVISTIVEAINLKKKDEAAAKVVLENELYELLLSKKEGREI